MFIWAVGSFIYYSGTGRSSKEQIEVSFHCQEEPLLNYSTVIFLYVLACVSPPLAQWPLSTLVPIALPFSQGHHWHL